MTPLESTEILVVTMIQYMLLVLPSLTEVAPKSVGCVAYPCLWQENLSLYLLTLPSLLLLVGFITPMVDSQH